ncbi:SDR family NAD(P)-dependent oxidoreductase [Saccharospirillum sp. HFRX-1]|uniref:SDR family NAD(P)-dependent oxidoreductase n=1 Tax=unclassified Saccharospirillum TaxID=2633430 RepID=UPI003713D07E
MKKTALITGATSGLGLALVKQLVRHKDIHFILPVRDIKRGQQLVSTFSGAQQERIRLLEMDLADLATVRAAADSLHTPIDILIFNAGVQSAETTIYTKDNLEQTFAVNHLAHFVLLRKLENLLTDEAIIGWVGSGTHHPELAKAFGFTGAHYRDPELLAKGQYHSEANTRQSSRDAYATSKGLNIFMARYLASRGSSRSYFAIDPGLMPGTGLAREGSLGLRLAWKYVLPMAAKFMKGTSTPKRSAAMLARVLLKDKKITSGDYVEYTGHLLEPFMPQDETAYGQRLFDYSDGFVAPGS